MSRPTEPHPVNPSSPRPHTPSRPTTPPTNPSKAGLRTFSYCVIAASIEGSVAIAVYAGRVDLLIFAFLMTYLIVSLALPRVPRHRAQQRASGTAASWSGVASAAVPSSSPSSRLRQNAATVG